MGKVRMISTETESVNLREDEIAGKIQQLFHTETFVYIVLDYAVVLGTYKDSRLQIRMPSGQITDFVPWRHVQEIMVFNSTQELKLRRVKEKFCGRFRKDGAEVCGELYVMDEAQKLWGDIKKRDNGWTLLSSARGSIIWVPVVFERSGGERKSDAIDGKENRPTFAGIWVRQYMELPPASEQRGLVRWIDERFTGFCVWPQEGVEGDE